MIDDLKKQPLIGLALSVASGYLLARVIVHLMGQFLDLYGEPDPWLATGALSLTTLIVIGTLFWSGARMFIWHHKRKLAITILLVAGVIGFAVHRQSVIEKSESTAAFQVQLRQQLVADAEQERQRQAAKAEEDRRFQKLLADTAAKERRLRQRAGLPPN